MAKQHHSLTDKLAVTKEICTLYATDKYTLENVCEKAGITARTFKNWRFENSDISELFRKAQQKAKKAKKVRLKLRALTALELHLKVRESKETTKDHLGNVTTKVKTILPNPTLIMFTLKNTDPENWKDKQEVDIKEKIESFSIKIKESRDAA